MAEKITLEEALRENKELKAKIAELTEMVNYLQKQLFGKKTEKLSAGQLDLRASIILCTFENPSLYEMLT